MNTRRWLNAAAVTIASATLALAGLASDALAGNTAATGTIKACYKTGTALVPLNHVGNTDPHGHSYCMQGESSNGNVNNPAESDRWILLTNTETHC